MDFGKLDLLVVPCRHCGKPIRQKDLATFVMVRVLVPQANRYRADGPFHEACGKAYDKQVTGSRT